MTKNPSYSIFDNDHNTGCVVEKLGNGAVSYTHYDDEEKSRGLKFTVTEDGDIIDPWVKSYDNVLASETLALINELKTQKRIDQFKEFVGKLTGKIYEKPTHQEQIKKAYAGLEPK